MPAWVLAITLRPHHRHLRLLPFDPVLAAMTAAVDGVSRDTPKTPMTPLTRLSSDRVDKQGDNAGRPVERVGSLTFKGHFLDVLVNNSNTRIQWDKDDDTLMMAFLAQHRIADKNKLNAGKEEEMRELGAGLGYKHRAGKEFEKYWETVKRRIKSSMEYKLSKLKENERRFVKGMNADKTLEIWEWRPEYRKQCLREGKLVLKGRQREEDDGGEEQQPAPVAGDIISSEDSESGQDDSDTSAMTGIIFYGAAREKRQDEPGRSTVTGRSATTDDRFVTVIDSSTDSSSTDSSTESSSDYSSSESGESGGENESESDVGDRGGDDNSSRLAAAEEVVRLRHRLIDRAARRRLALDGFDRAAIGSGGWNAGDTGDGDGQQLWEQLSAAMGRLRTGDPLAMPGVAMFLVRRAEEGRKEDPTGQAKPWRLWL